MHTVKSKKILMLRPIDIKIPPYKKINALDFSIIPLTKSIKKLGVITPLTIRLSKKKNYELVCGSKRLYAAIKAGIRRIPCILHDLSDEQAYIYSFLENYYKCSDDFFLEAENLKYIMQKFKISNYEASQFLGISQNELQDKLRLMRLSDDLRQRIMSTNLALFHAKNLLKVSPDIRNRVLDKSIKSNLNAKECELLVNELLNTNKKPETAPIRKPVQKSSIADIRIFSNSISKLCDTLNKSGFDAYSRRTENEKYVEYKIRIKKEEVEKICPEQLRIC